MFLLVISVNHTNTIFKVSLWILLTRKSLDNAFRFMAASNIGCILSMSRLMGISMKSLGISVEGNGTALSSVNCIKRLELQAYQQQSHDHRNTIEWREPTEGRLPNVRECDCC
jgi:hypothetical protein